MPPQSGPMPPCRSLPQWPRTRHRRCSSNSQRLRHSRTRGRSAGEDHVSLVLRRCEHCTDGSVHPHPRGQHLDVVRECGHSTSQAQHTAAHDGLEEGKDEGVGISTATEVHSSLPRLCLGGREQGAVGGLPHGGGGRQLSGRGSNGGPTSGDVEGMGHNERGCRAQEADLQTAKVGVAAHCQLAERQSVSQHGGKRIRIRQRPHDPPAPSRNGPRNHGKANAGARERRQGHHKMHGPIPRRIFTTSVVWGPHRGCSRHDGRWIASEPLDRRSGAVTSGRENRTGSLAVN